MATPSKTTPRNDAFIALVLGAIVAATAAAGYFLLAGGEEGRTAARPSAPVEKATSGEALPPDRH